jgi:hypothetical protein
VPCAKKGANLGQARTVESMGGGGREFVMQIEHWYLGPVPTYRVNKDKGRRGIRQQTADRRQRESKGGRDSQKRGTCNPADYEYYVLCMVLLAVVGNLMSLEKRKKSDVPATHFDYM